MEGRGGEGRDRMHHSHMQPNSHRSSCMHALTSELMNAAILVCRDRDEMGGAREVRSSDEVKGAALVDAEGATEVAMLEGGRREMPVLEKPGGGRDSLTPHPSPPSHPHCHSLTPSLLHTLTLSHLHPSPLIPSLLHTLTFPPPHPLHAHSLTPHLSTPLPPHSSPPHLSTPSPHHSLT